MEIKVSKQNGVTVVTVTGSIDALTAAEVTAFLNTQIEQGENQLVLDFSPVDYVSSAGLRVILGALKETRSQGGDLRLAGAQPGVSKLLQMSGFNTILKIYPEVDTAVASFT